jgi:hypothetical protein
MPKYRNDNADQKTIFAGGRAFLYGYTEEIYEYVYDPDLTLVSHVPHATKALKGDGTKIDLLIEDDLTIGAGESKFAGPFNMQAIDFGAARSFGLLVKASGPANAELTVDVKAARLDTSGEYWPFETPVVPISGEAPTDVHRTFDLEQCEAVVFEFASATAQTVITEAQLMI